MKWCAVGVLLLFFSCIFAQCYQITNHYNSFQEQQNYRFSVSTNTANNTRFKRIDHANAIRRLNQLPVSYFAHYFGYKLPGRLSVKRQRAILEQLEWYKYPGFREYIKQFPLYEEHVEHLYNKFRCCKRCSKKLCKKAGYKKFSQIINELHNQVEQAQ